MSSLWAKALRFIEIDYQYLFTDDKKGNQLKNILATNSKVAINLLRKPSNYSPVTLNGRKVFYDTPYATKTFLTALYDLYIVSMKKTIITSESPVIVDVGANIGQFMFAAKNLFPDAKVVSVEPDKDIYRLLEKNAISFENVTAINAALSNENGEKNFYTSKDFSEWSSLKKIEGKEYETTVVKTKKGDEVFRKLKHIDILKIDVEGAEYEVISGLLDTLPKTKYLLIELSLERNLDDPGSTKLLKLLLSQNFTLFHIGRIFSAGKGEYQAAVDVLFKNLKFDEKKK